MTPELVNLIVIIGAVAFAVYGFAAGIIKQIGSVAGLAVGFIASRLLGAGVSESMNINPFIGSAIVFALFYFCAGIVVSVVRRTAHLIFLGTIDRILGALMGIINWLLLTSLLLNLLIYYNPDTDLVSGKFATIAVDFLPMIIGVAQEYISTNG